MFDDETEDIDLAKPGQWDELRINYLLHSLPAKFIEPCAVECETLAATYDLRIELDGVYIKPGQLYSTLQKVADVLTAELDEPGSESLGILRALYHGR